MKISVIIPAYNEEKYIEGCLSRLFNQEEKPDEVIVVNNNSIDRTVVLAKKFPVRVINERRQGVTPTRNKGFDKAKHPLLGRIDADTLVPPNWVKEIKKRFAANPNLIAFSGSVYFADKKINALLKIPSLAYNISFKKIVGCDCLYGPNMAIRKSAWKKVKSQACTDDRLVHEDIDLAIHLSELKLGQIVFDPNFAVEVSDRRWKNVNYSYLEYPYRYLKTILKHKEAIQLLNKKTTNP